MKISVLHITCRPELAIKVREVWLSLADRPERIEYLFCFDELKDDLTHNKECDILKKYPHVMYHGYSLGACKKSCEVAKASTGKIMIQVGDNHKPQKGWDTLLENCANWNKQVALYLTNNTSNRKDLLYWCMSRSRYEYLGYWQNPRFTHVYADDWMTWEAKQDGCVVLAPHIILSPLDGVSTINDATHSKTNSQEQYQSGRNIFEQLKDEYHAKK